jgi:hypothetical protein
MLRSLYKWELAANSAMVMATTTTALLLTMTASLLQRHLHSISG